jgi:mRNA interferase MazF
MDGMKRGDLVAVVVSGDYGKPRPALVVQDDAFAALHSVTVLLVTSDLHDGPLMRISIQPTPENGLRRPSQAMIDKTMTLPRAKVGQIIGRVDAGTMKAVDAALAKFFGLAGLYDKAGSS